MKDNTLIFGTLILILLIVIFVIFSKRGHHCSRFANAPAPASPYNIKIHYDLALGAYVSPVEVNGITPPGGPAAIIDTGSPMLNLPLMYPVGIDTGASQVINYGASVSSSAVSHYQIGTVTIGGVRFDGLEFAASPAKSATAAMVKAAPVGTYTPTLGLMSMKTPAGIAALKGTTPVDQLNIVFIMVDMVKGNLMLVPAGAAKPTMAKSPICAATMMSNAKLWGYGVDQLGDYYVVPVLVTNHNKSTKKTMVVANCFAIIDTGTTYNQLPAFWGNDGTGDVSYDLNFDVAPGTGSGRLSLASGDTSRNVLASSGLPQNLGVIGNRSLNNHILTLDLVNSEFKLY